jgi:hypothetical protein
MQIGNALCFTRRQELQQTQYQPACRDDAHTLAKPYLKAALAFAKGMFGDKAKLDPISHLLGTAYGWGGNPEEAAISLSNG